MNTETFTNDDVVRLMEIDELLRQATYRFEKMSDRGLARSLDTATSQTQKKLAGILTQWVRENPERYKVVGPARKL